MTHLIPVKSPQLLVRPVDETYFYVVNCSFPNSLRLLNRTQYEILCAIDGKTPIPVLSDKLGIQQELLEEFLLLLTRTEIVRLDHNFSQPEKPQHPESLNYWVHTTNKCNLSCGYCYIPTLNSTGGMTEAVRQQFLNKLVQTVRRKGIKHIRLRLAGGEPLIQFKAWKSFIPEARRTLNELGCRLEFSFITNLTILTDEIIQFSKEHQISFGVSLDGVRQHHDATRTFRSGTGSFKAVKSNLCRLIAHRIPVSVNTVVSNSNLTGLPDLTRYLIDLNIPFRYSLVKGESIDADLLETHLSESYALMKAAVQTGWSFTSQHQFCDLKPSSLGYQTCASGFSGGAIAVDGTVNYCHVHFGDKIRSVHTLRDESIDLVDMIEQGSHEENDRSADCRSCRYKSVCTSGCPVYRVNGKDPQCSLYHRFIPLIYDIQAMERLILMQNCTKM